jgi:hypothetical protein
MKAQGVLLFVQRPAALPETYFSHKYGVKMMENGPRQFVLTKKKDIFQLLRYVQKVLQLRNK